MERPLRKRRGFYLFLRKDECVKMQISIGRMQIDAAWTLVPSAGTVFLAGGMQFYYSRDLPFATAAILGNTWAVRLLLMQEYPRMRPCFSASPT